MNRIKWKIENIVVPVFLAIFSFYDFNYGIDLADAGLFLNYYLYFDSVAGENIIPTYWSNAVGHFFTLLPYGDTWIGIMFYCTIVIMLTVLIAYFFCKKFLDYRIVALAEMVALFYGWGQGAVLYNYLSFLLFELAMVLLFYAIIKDSKWLYFFPGILLGLNTFVRIPNVTEISAIVAVWFAGFYKKEKISWIITRTILCVAGYLSGIGISCIFIFSRYSIQDFKLAIYYLFSLGQSETNYSIWYMAFQTVQYVLKYSIYLLYFIMIIIIAAVLIEIINKKMQNKEILDVTLRRCSSVLLCILVWISYIVFSKYFKLYATNYWVMEAVIGLASLFLLWGIVVSVIRLIRAKELRDKLLAILFLGIFYITPLGSNNHIYLAVMNMFLLIPLVIYQTIEIEKDMSVLWKRVNRNTEAFALSFRTVLCASAVVMIIQSALFGAVYVFNDIPEEYVTGNSIISGMKTNSELADSLQGMLEYSEENQLSDKKAIFYCCAPGLSFTLRIESMTSSPWPDWYTYSFDQFYEGLINSYAAAKAGDAPLIFFDRVYGNHYLGNYEAFLENGGTDYLINSDEKYLMLHAYMKEFGYECVYQDARFFIMEAAR